MSTKHLVHGEYIIDTSKTIGGVNSKIYEAFHLKTGEAAIAKVVNYSDNHRNTFIREVQALSNLNDKYSPGIIPLLYYTENISQGVMILPRMKSDLLDLLQAQPQSRFSESVAKQLILQILRGVQSCHIQGIAHLDLKPENVFLSKSGTVFLGDFGSSYSATHDRFIKGCVGTPIYAPPEFTTGKCYDPFLADIWSLGVMCFVLVTGTWPYSATQAACMQTGSPFYLNQKELRSRMKPYLLSRELEEFISMMLQYHPRMRASIDDLLDHRWLKDPVDPVDSTPTTSKEDTSTETTCSGKSLKRSRTGKLSKLRESLKIFFGNHAL